MLALLLLAASLAQTPDSGSLSSTQPPTVVSAPQPEYTDDARHKKISGDVVVALTVDSNGMPQNVRILKGLGHGLDEKALQAVSQYRFKPAMHNGTPVPVELRVNVNFRVF